MKTSRASTTISLLFATLHCLACWYPSPTPRDNMIYRLVEDVAPYYVYDATPYFRPSNNAVSDEYFCNENIRLWRKQTGTTLADADIRRLVYDYSTSELQSHKETCIKHLGRDAYDFLLYAKQCESIRSEMNDPWYYPMKNDPLTQDLEGISERGMKPQGRFFNRYVLQAIRALTTLHKDSLAVAFWEQAKPKMADDVIKTMTERHVAIAYRKTRQQETAKRIYARIGDLTSLYSCCDNKAEIWHIVFQENPNSPFFTDVMQSLLTHLDNRYLDRMATDYNEIEEEEMEQLEMALETARTAINDKRVKGKAMWYYSAAALLDAKSLATERSQAYLQQALHYARLGQSHCRRGTFIERSMRVLRIYLEAQTSLYDSAYIAHLANDIEWLSEMARRNITPALKQTLSPRTIEEYDGETFYRYTAGVSYTNKMYWSDAINRILADVLATRLKKQGKTVDALLLANLGEFWLPRNATGKAHSPNEPGPYSFTDHSNAMAAMADTCSANELIAMYRRIRHPQNAMDRMVRDNGKTDKDYWCDVIGTHCIAEHRYKDAVAWLRQSGNAYQRNMPTWYWADRDPFCMKFGSATAYRHLIHKEPDYKLNFAKRMVELQQQMHSAKDTDKRAEAMILYGVGLRNQSDWCWTLSRFSDHIDTHEEFVDTKRSQAMIDKGLATMKDRELKAYYLHSFARNREVIELCDNTKTAKMLRARCDMWRDYKKKT